MEEAKQVQPNVKKLIIVSIFTALVVLYASYIKYFYQKDYQFLVETPCDIETSTCFVRSCDDYCPPNGLETYSTYSIKAADYNLCTNNSCSNVCGNPKTANLCIPIQCNPEEGDERSE